jgi:hypothetical protein
MPTKTHPNRVRVQAAVIIGTGATGATAGLRVFYNIEPIKL